MSDLKTCQYWLHFKQNMESKYFDMVCNNRLKTLASCSPDDLFNSPNLLLFGADVSLLKLYVDAMLQRIFRKPIVKHSTQYDLSCNNNKYQCGYKYSDVHIEVDLGELGVSDKQFISEFIVQRLGTMRNINQAKHLVVLHNVSQAGHLAVSALRKAMDFTRNITFILTTRSLSVVDESMQSRCMAIRCNTEPDDLEAFYEQFVTDVGLDSGDKPLEIDPNDGIILTLLQFSNPNAGKSAIHVKLKDFLSTLATEKNLEKGCSSIRTFSHKILHFNVPVAHIFKECLKIFSDMPKMSKHLVDIAVLSADLDAKSAKMSKPVIVLEQYFVHIYRLFIG